ncbi:OLC1v1022095C1 [Oldenlandia corymbosa var. corymbosa]|uniref:OLC1v1022095C1 n=1 Tax=Oldenlandia corymbosa var. corymbosa TaxID=529605 RepID=A0AAV1C762_OLDCO|nr:OLC1v1022095C1 [Oldenlandia corymbosa var. corymbosa]
MSDISESSGKTYGVSRTVWTEGDMKLFVDILLEYKRKGEMKQNNFGKSWVKITKDFNAKSEYRQTLEQLSQKFHRFRIDWNAFKDLREKHTGLGWDHEKGTITASEERWKELIKTNKNYKKFQQQETIRDEDGDKSSGEKMFTVLEAFRLAKLKPDKNMYLLLMCKEIRNSQVDVSGGKKAVVIHVPYRLRKAFRKIHVRLVRELEKKFSGKFLSSEFQMAMLTTLPPGIHILMGKMEGSSNLNNEFMDYSSSSDEEELEEWKLLRMMSDFDEDELEEIEVEDSSLPPMLDLPTDDSLIVEVQIDTKDQNEKPEGQGR